jgi:hypothetical protein
MLYKLPKTIQVSELRKNLAGHLRHAEKEPVIVSTDRGANTRVILSSGLYNKLIEVYEDYIDARELTALVKNDTGKRIPLRRSRNNK